MALINCPECGKEISENAVACPNCGNPISKQPIGNKNVVSQRKSILNKILFGIGAAIIAFIIYAIAVAPSQQMTPDKANNLLKEAEQDFKEQVEKDNYKAREYIRVIQSDYSTLKEKREAYNELIKIKETFSKYSIEEIENMK
jgi:uncharacterized membrane protein YvbJ